MNKCKHCGDALTVGDACLFSVHCLKAQLAAVTAERDELQRKMEECREAWPHIVVAHLMDANDDEIAAESTLNRHLGGE
jgi:hypothetical protein